MDVLQTKYKGILYRSRTEARWAAFFDKAGIDVEYEPEGYRLSNGIVYLPDFYAPRLRRFFEVKGGHPTPAEVSKAALLEESTGKEVWFLVGTPSVDANQVMRNGIWGNFAACRRCGAVWLEDCKDGMWGTPIDDHSCDRCGEKNAIASNALVYAAAQRFGVHE